MNNGLYSDKPEVYNLVFLGISWHRNELSLLPALEKSICFSKRLLLDVRTRKGKQSDVRLDLPYNYGPAPV